MGHVPGDCIKRNFMRQQGDLPNAEERRLFIVQTLTEELGETIKKVNYHFHSGYEQNDERIPESIFMNFFKKRPSIIHSSYLMRIKNRDFRLELDADKYVKNIRFTDLAYETFKGMTDTITLLNEACAALDYEALKAATNTVDKFFQTTRKIIQGINDFKFGT